MELGVCTWIFGDVALEHLLPAVAKCGVDGIELLSNLRPIEGARVRRLLADEGLSVFSLTPIDVDRHGQEIDLAHPDDTIRQRSIDAYREMLDLAVSVGAPILACHGRVGRASAVTRQAEEEALFVDSIRQVAEHAASLDVRIACEVLNRYETHLARSVEAAIDLVSSVGVPGLGLLLDTYHMNIEEANLIESVAAAADRMILFHVADSNRRAPGRGHVPFSQLIEAVQAIGYRGPWIIECVPPSPNPFAVDPESYERTLQEVTESSCYLRALEEA